MIKRRALVTLALLAVLIAIITTLNCTTAKSPELVLASQTSVGDQGSPDWGRYIRTSDGGLATLSVNVLQKFGPDGALQWEHSYGWSGASSLIQASDGGYVIAYSLPPVGQWEYAGIVKTDASGNVEWNQTFYGPFRAYGQDVTQTADGGFLLLAGASDATSIINGDIHDQGQLYLVKLDSAGNKQWDRLYALSPELYRVGDGDTISRIIRTGDGGFLVFGTHGAWGLSEPENLMIVKVSASGDLISKQIFSGTNAWFQDVIPVDRGVLLSIPTGPGINTLMKLDDNGAVQWSRTMDDYTPLGLTQSTWVAYGTWYGHWDSTNVIPDGDGGFYMLAQELTGDKSAGIIKMSRDGSIEWFKAMGPAYEKVILSASNGSFRLLGWDSGMVHVDTFRDAVPGEIAFKNQSYFVNSGSGNFSIALLRQGGADGIVSVNYSALDGSAIDGMDYSLANGTLTFGDNETVTNLTVTLLRRNLTDTNVSFSLALENVSGGASLGSPNVTSVIISYAITPTPAPVLVESGIALPFLNNNDSSGLFHSPTMEKTISTISVLVIGIFIVWLWPWLGKLLDFLLSGLKTYLQGQYSSLEKKLRKTTAVEHVPFLFGLSSQEIMVGLISAILLGAAVAYAKGQLFVLWSFVLLIFIAGFTAVIHEIAHRYFAYRYKTSTEYKLWDAGVITLIVTALLHQPFSTPARTIVNDVGKLDKKTQGIIFLVGPMASILLSIGFLLLILYGHGLKPIGDDGFKLSMMACVYQLMPINPLEGVMVLKWDKWAWAIVFLPALAFYLGMLLFVL